MRRAGIGTWVPPALVVAVFLASRAVYHAAGVRFDDGPLTYGMQFIDVGLLRHDLLRSLWYLHSQPPLFNLMVGIVLKLFGGYAVVAFEMIYLLLGLALHLSMYFLAVRLGARPWIAAGIAALFAITPASIFTESWLTYSYPVTVLLCVATLFLHRALDRERAADGVVFFGLTGALTMIWSVFIGLWFLGTVAFVARARRSGARGVLGLAMVPLIAVAGVHVKNGVLFGSPSTSSWAGMNLAALTTAQIPRFARVELVRRGQLSPMSLAGRFVDVKDLRPYFPEVGPSHVPVLDQEYKTPGADGEVGPNFNNIIYVVASRQTLRDDLSVLVHQPRLYLAAVKQSFIRYALPASDRWFWGRPGADWIWRWDEICNAVLYGSFVSGRSMNPTLRFATAGLLVRISFTWMAAILVVIVASLIAGRRVLGRGRTGSATSACLLFIGLNILFVTILGNACDVGENNRFRFTIDPLVWVVLAALLSRVRWPFARRPSVARSSPP